MSSAAPGWYPVEGDDRLRYWDGQQWTDQFQARQPQGQRGQLPADTIWSAVGKPVTGIGAGRFWLTRQYLFFERGTLRTDSQQVPIAGVVDVDVRQTMTQKARGVFDVLVHINRGSRTEIVAMDDIPNGREAQRIINETAHAARLAIQQAQNTHHYTGQGAPFQQGAQYAPAQGAEPAMSAAPDYIEQLRKLGDLRDAGILTDEEFAAKKADILGRL